MTDTDTRAEAVSEAVLNTESFVRQLYDDTGAPQQSVLELRETVHALFAERDTLRQQLAEARNAALEEAAGTCNDKGADEQFNYGLTRSTQNYFRARDSILALKTTKGDSEDG